MKHQQTDGPPCKQMETLLQELASGNAKGWRRWYAVSHAAQCSRCGNFLERMKVTLAAVKASKSETVNEESMKRLTDMIQNIDSKK